MRSITRKKRTNGQVCANAKSGFVRDDSPYPAKTNGFRRFILSDQYPEKTFSKDAVVSAAPSTRPTTQALAPSDSKNKGTTGNTIWLDKSVKRLTKPTITIFRANPWKKVCLFIGYLM
jgi:hypothetical protein